MTEEESPITFRHRAIRFKKLKLRSTSLRIGSPARDAIDDPILATMGGGPIVDRASGQVAIEMTQAVVSDPDLMATSRPRVIANKQAIIMQQISREKEKVQW
ncbi:hypothetical protein R1flu_004714 [Riccia fluitans]|uniref:Uncharacterized protein n=1 Tax=Riccia fluitans TaxID=41844 RepID=A0ABD1YRX7_9MARC